MATFLIASTITARVLGPSGRGYYSSVILLATLFVQVFNGGLGEASVVLTGRGVASLQTAVSTTVALVAALSTVGASIFLFTSLIALSPATQNERLALTYGALLVLVNVWMTTVTWFLVARERLVVVAGLTMLCATITTVSVWVVVAIAHAGPAGAVSASVAGCVSALVVMVYLLRADDLSFKPAWDRRYLSQALQFGMAVQMSNLLVQMAGRLDLIFVYRIAGPAAAGRYSVALTLGALVGSAAIAISFASFAKLSRVPDDEARALTAQVFRVGMMAALASALFLIMTASFLLRAVFGPAYASALQPSLVLIPTGVLWSGQWILARSAAAMGAPKSIFVSFALSLFVMIALDIVLIPPFGTVGAAAASLVAAAVGAVVAGSYYFNKGWDWRQFVPRLADVGLIATTIKRLLAIMLPSGSRSATPRTDR